MENFYNKYIKQIDFPTLILTYVLIFIGILLIYSATHNNDNAWIRLMYRSQLIKMVIGTIGIYFIILLPLRVFYDYAYVVYFITLCLLLLVLVSGSSSGGAMRWFYIGPLKLQPSEFAKIGTLIALARYLASRNISFQKISGLIMPSIIILIPTALVLKQPDLSTSLVFFSMFLPMLFWSGLTLFEIFFLLSPLFSLVLAANIYLWAFFFIILFFILIKYNKNIVISIVFLGINFIIGIFIPMLWDKLHDYQQNRILSFIDPMRDPFGAGYQVIQSKVAIGSGLLTGKGFLKGTQTRLSFLPEQHTDFIFSVLGEQFGLIGCSFVILLFALLLGRLFYLTSQSNNRFINLMIIGVASQIAFHIFTNISMTVGMMPVTGLPLPFISYGGSFLITCMLLMGFVISIPKKQEDY